MVHEINEMDENLSHLEDDNKSIFDNEESGRHYTEGYIVGVSFLGNSKSYFFHSYDSNFVNGEKVVVETVRGIELGSVTKEPKNIKEFSGDLVLRPIIRKSDEKDIKNYEDNIINASKALEVCKESVEKLGLDMRLLKADYTLDASKIIIVYSSENRVDFRELLKDLAAKLKCRIELRQIGTRDRSKIIGGLGVCGLPLCCNTFLGTFDGISINMAKNQFLVLNIQKLSGHCGKLICCLKYEDDNYSEQRKGLPKIGQKIFYQNEQYKVTSINILTKQVRLENKENVQTINLKELMDIVNNQKNR
ncbi:MAG: regulatory iron-sulfur-containing complex subunit RicT [Bacilli bacterium]